MFSIQQHFERVYSLAVEAINLLFYIHNRFLDHQNQQYVVFQFSELATTACFLVFQTKHDFEIILEVLEQERELILRFFMNDRNDIFELKTDYSELYARYENFRLKVNKSVENITDDKT